MKKRCATLDRFEGDWAILLEGRRALKRPRAALPADAKEGDVIELASLTVDAAATEALRREVREARQRSEQGKRRPPGSFDL